MAQLQTQILQGWGRQLLQKSPQALHAAVVAFARHPQRLRLGLVRLLVSVTVLHLMPACMHASEAPHNVFVPTYKTLGSG